MADDKRGFVLVSLLNNKNHQTERIGAVVMLQTCIEELLCSNFGKETGYHDDGFHAIPKFHHANSGILPLGQGRLFPNTS